MGMLRTQAYLVTIWNALMELHLSDCHILREYSEFLFMAHAVFCQQENASYSTQIIIYLLQPTDRLEWTTSASRRVMFSLDACVTLL